MRNRADAGRSAPAQRGSTRRRAARWGRLALAAGRASVAASSLPLLAVSGLLALPLPSGAEPEALASPPQRLPLTARWCLQPSTGAPLCIQLEEPRSPRQYMMGLQLRPPLPPLRGMWFRFDPPEPARFWMHRTIAPLDMVFVSEGKVVFIEAGAAPCPNLPCRSYGPGVSVEGVLELAAGEAARLGIIPGTPVRIEPLTKAATGSPASP